MYYNEELEAKIIKIMGTRGWLSTRGICQYLFSTVTYTYYTIPGAGDMQITRRALSRLAASGKITQSKAGSAIIWKIKST
jgi:hypothetical protein